MNTKKFGGFTEEQMAAIAKDMGHEGPMEKFNDFLAESPDRATRLSRMTEKARNHVESGVQELASGGTVKKKKTVTKNTSGVTNTGVDVKNLTQQAITNPNAAVTPVKVTPTTVNANQFIDPKTGQVKPAAPQGQTAQATTSTATAAPQTEANLATTTTTAPKVNQVTEALNQGAHGTVSENAQATAAEALPSKDATVQGQLEGLMAQFEGGETPAWAAGALRKANELAASRGLGQSSVALSASTQAAMESAIQIAVADASTYSAFEMKNLDNRQQAALQNAQSFLQMDLANLDNDQTALLTKTQLRTQALFTDAAAANATSQFNATSQNQTDQFFASLKTQVSQFNAAQRNATSQFNAGQKNTMEQFNKSIQEQRDEFNAQNALIIAQANAKWRQTIATQDNASVNEANRQNAQAANGLTQSAYDAIWQKERDLMAFAFTAAENAEQRSHEVVMQKAGAKASGKTAMYTAAGNLVGQLMRNVDIKDFF